MTTMLPLITAVIVTCVNGQLGQAPLFNSFKDVGFGRGGVLH